MFLFFAKKEAPDEAQEAAHAAPAPA